MSLTGKFLIAMPGMTDGFFERTIVYVCSHTPEGAMGLVVNRDFDGIDYENFLEQLGIAPADASEQIHIHVGGPVEPNRGFVLHSSDVLMSESMVLDQDLALTATPDILRAIITGGGPQRWHFALGCAGWAPGQLDQEIQQNAWLHMDYDQRLLFETALDKRYERSLSLLGISPALLSPEMGTA